MVISKRRALKVLPDLLRMIIVLNGRSCIGGSACKSLDWWKHRVVEATDAIDVLVRINLLYDRKRMRKVKITTLKHIMCTIT
jgi:hypothetical protein